MTLNILIAPSGFKESLGAEEVADSIADGIARVLPNVKPQKVPLADGGEGFAKALIKSTNGKSHNLVVTGPAGQPVHSYFGILGGNGPKSAALEMASAAGLRHVPINHRDPLTTTTYGVGELIKAALDAGAERLLIGCGDSGTNDGGAGMAQALGAHLLDDKGDELGWGGGELARLKHVALDDMDRRIKHVQIDVACNWHNVLCGSNGVARVFGPQKGASSETVEQLAAALDNYADVIESDLNINVRRIPGGGSSGGLGVGLHAFLEATLHPWSDVVMQYLDVDDLISKADIVFTAEGCLDYQTPMGKIPAEIAKRAKHYHLPVIVLAGTIGKDAHVNFEHGIDSFLSILEAPCTLSQAIENARPLLTNTAERVMRLLLAGHSLGRTGVVS